ncbi:16584_t:CDS:2 [Funneliformis geosporum]|uniref:16584_t:CDS:1 n=1 Tax=Funneliformis geosporum TaxID=1117311 RepID=A0A9W4WRH4_9GLOM|nr:16584_t:CDS:2 [Funneliformis geosporum]
MECIPYTRLKNITKIAQGGFSNIYQATWLNSFKNDHITVAIKSFFNSQDFSKYLLNEIKSYHYCYKERSNILQCYGVTKNPDTNEYMIVMQYAKENLHEYLQKHFANIECLKTIHNVNFIHRDLHSGNILLIDHECQIGDLGLSQPANNPLNNDIYGVVPYIAPEIFLDASFSKASDIYKNATSRSL